MSEMIKKIQDLEWQREWKELWKKNYKGIGDTADLEKHIKKLGYGARTNISYLPWAVVERIFRLQGGEVYWNSVNDNTYVDADFVSAGMVPDPDTGELVEKLIKSYFIRIQAVWMGVEYTERYPLQDSNGRPLLSWTQNDLNKAYQRGKVKAIAIVSGIGYKLFEDGDLQFEEDKKKVVKEPVKKVAPVKDNWNRMEVEQFIKREFLNGDDKAKEIKRFLVENKIKKVGELSVTQVKELEHILKNWKK
jgi:hypothetical protein